MRKAIFWVVGVISVFMGSAVPALAVSTYDVSTVTLDTAPAFAIGLTILGGIGAMWIIRKVYVLMKKS